MPRSPRAQDVTQQQLCSVAAASLIEKSARFHVLCAVLLLELPAGAFDPKINSENLTKCLQTLREQYIDLRWGVLRPARGKGLLRQRCPPAGDGPLVCAACVVGRGPELV